MKQNVMNVVVTSKVKQWPWLQLLLLGIILTFWMASAWPAVMTADSFDSWNQLQTNSYSDWHPVAFTLYIKVVSLNGMTPGLVSCFQLVLFSYTFFRLFKLLKPEWKLSRQLNLVSAMMVLPFFGNMAVTLWKDVPYAIFSVLGLVLIAEGIKLGSRGNIFGIALTAVGSTFRHEGIFVLSLTLFFLLIYSVNLRLKSRSVSPISLIAKSIAISILVSWVISTTSLSVTNAVKMPSWPRYFSFMADLAYVAATTPEKLSPKNLSIIQEISSGESLSAAKNCDTATGMIYSPGWSGSAIEKYKDQILSLWLEEAQSKAGQQLMFAHFCRGAAFLPPPFSTGLRGDFWEWTWWGSEPNNIFPNLEGLSSNPLVSQIEPIAAGWRGLWWVNGRAFAWPGLHLVISFSLLLLLRRREIIPSKTWALFGYLGASHLVLVAFGAVPAYRYAIATHILSLTLIGITTVEFGGSHRRGLKEKTTNESKKSIKPY
jgi:hypothetical protein